ncbi:MAG: ubiquinone biosynthesis methyltransferase UbiE [Nitrospinae bacterium CG11_big_fil_rev_8_21_14_0_20_56_8]|nr:MAG: ubiquinone biosynthesis methyltransferase UbiE [Nitrospinae bacterium CG11_big_fil_rev_8_21_14_0_20_56_8]
MNENACCGGSSGAEERVTRDDVRDFYSKAALATQDNLCCPAPYDEKDLAHIPAEVRNISYGCGSPVNRAGLRPGEVLTDLGSGGGIDCFIAAQLVGATGQVYGIDMTDEMLAKARTNAAIVAENLGYSNVFFKKGFLEQIPLEDETADVVTSNCVINLSVDKPAVFREIRRILKSRGRFVISDIISDRPVPREMRKNRELWGECASGALTLTEFFEACTLAGFHGFTVNKDYLWKEIEGIKFYSYTLSGHKAPAAEASCCSSLTATYIGPFNSVNCNGVIFPIGIAVDIDEPTAELLHALPYAGLFQIVDSEEESPASDSCCG